MKARHYTARRPVQHKPMARMTGRRVLALRMAAIRLPFERTK